MNVEIGAEAALFPENEYINGISLAVRYDNPMPESTKSPRQGLRISPQNVFFLFLTYVSRSTFIQ